MFVYFYYARSSKLPLAYRGSVLRSISGNLCINTVTIISLKLLYSGQFRNTCSSFSVESGQLKHALCS